MKFPEENEDDELTMIGEESLKRIVDIHNVFERCYDIIKK